MRQVFWRALSRPNRSSTRTSTFTMAATHPLWVHSPSGSAPISTGQRSPCRRKMRRSRIGFMWALFSISFLASLTDTTRTQRSRCLFCRCSFSRPRAISWTFLATDTKAPRGGSARRRLKTRFLLAGIALGSSSSQTICPSCTSATPLGVATTRPSASTSSTTLTLLRRRRRQQ
eukprot:Amastigsp_a341972_7.p4 type:complete len:174 gc:universal Amastigsp_a341972_7:1201-680(-)